MRVVCAPNAFKGALDAAGAAGALLAGVSDAGARGVPVPLADGGDGTAAVLAAARGGVWHTLTVPDPWGTPHQAPFALLRDGTAVVDLAAASGLGARRPAPEQALAAASTGTGALLAAALRLGARRVWVALGGSATSDGGTGLLRALGARFLDAAGHELPPGGGGLRALSHVDLRGLLPPPPEVTVLVDVRNPLLGPHGAACLFGPQKGADPAGVAALEAGLAHLADVLEAAGGRRARDLPGAGAAGGTAFGLVAAWGARICSGAEAVAEAVGLEEQLGAADLCLTGEGCIDGQTAFGKAPATAAALAARRGVPAVGLCGTLGAGWEGLLAPAGPLRAILPISPGPRSRQEALEATAADLRRTAATAVRLLAAGRIRETGIQATSSE